MKKRDERDVSTVRVGVAIGRGWASRSYCGVHSP